MSEKLSNKESKEIKEQAEHHESDIERARKSLEKRGERKENESVEEIRDTVEKHAQKASETVGKKAERTSQPSVSVSDKKQSYNQTMNRVRSKMNPASRAFSSFIHAPVVEQTTEVVGKTVARPSGIMGGGIAAVIGLGIVFFFARRNGFALSGSEFILLLLAGFVVGILFEIVGKVFKRS